MKNDAKLKGKDLINVGIYAAIYCVIMTAVAMLGFIPIMMPMLCVLVPLLGGIPMMLFMTKVKKFGMITIYSIIVGLFLWVTGMGYWPFIFGIVFNAEEYFLTRQSFGEAYITSLTEIMGNTWLAPLLAVSCLVCGIIGGFIGKAILKKHFVKAGIA